MKLNVPRSADAARQLEAWAVPEAHPANQSLSETFGEHTFFLDSDGLTIVEPGEAIGEDAIQLARIIRLAAWDDEQRTVLAPHERQETGLLIMLSEAA
jgi:hypothetical protein